MRDRAFEARVRRTLDNGRAAIVELIGFLDAHTVGDFESQMKTCLEGGASRIVLDLEKLTYVSSAGIGAMMSLTQRLRREAGDVALLRPSPKVFKILELLGFTEIFKIAAGEDEALKSLA
ncbi:MAG: STAS domain-containing protein [Candidatus Sumerlaeota bacterium]|nr:STAS domain-containing protein [Candidatus Sumerlaeota bacterium]